MITPVITAVLGFLGPFLPKVLDLWGRKIDNAHEIAMLKVQIESAKLEHAWKMEELASRADIEESKLLHAPDLRRASYGVTIIDALSKDKWPKWLIIPIIYLFAILDFVAGMVRPAITYSIVGFYMIYKWARYQYLVEISDGDRSVVLSLWGDQDWAILTLVLGFWFGNRTASKAFKWTRS